MPQGATAQRAVRKRAAVPARPTKRSIGAEIEVLGKAAVWSETRRVGGVVGGDGEAEFPEGFGHQVRVFAIERVRQRDGPVAEGGEEEGAVGEAFRAGQSDGATGGPREGLNE